MGWYYGFKLHLLCNERGELLNFALTKANVDDRNLEVFNNLTKDLFGKLYADKGYISQSLFASLFDRGVHIVTGIRTNMKNRLMDVQTFNIPLKKNLPRARIPYNSLCFLPSLLHIVLYLSVSQCITGEGKGVAAFTGEWRLFSFSCLPTMH